MTKAQMRMLLRILCSSVLLALVWLLPSEGIWKPLLYLLPYLCAGWDVIWRAVRNILHGQIFDENFLMALATVGAFCTGEYPEAVFVLVFYQVGELFQGLAVGKSRRAITSLMEIRPDAANLEKDGELKQVSPELVAVGDVIVVKAGERIPLDGVILEGRSSVDTAALTGESLPRDVEPGDDVVSGCVNQQGLLRVQVTRAFEDSTVSKILELIENSGSKKAKAENFITKFARYYTPCVVIGAVLLAVAPPLIFQGGWTEWIHRALIFLVISCPCALVISVPLSFFGGIGGASRQGILVKGGNYLEVLSRAEIVVFDKTGTLTKGVFNVTAIHPDACSENQLLEYAALAEVYSDHPISKSLREAYGKAPDRSRLEDVRELPGRGISAVIDGKTVCVGNNKLMDEIGSAWHPCHRIGTTVHVAVNSVYMGHIVISDEIKPQAAEAIDALRAAGIKKTVMLTGDIQAVGESVAADLRLDEVHAGLMPDDKVKCVEAFMKQKSGKGSLVFVGDGINDAPVLARADVGVAMGAMGSDAAIEAADIVLMDDQPRKLSEAICLSRRTLGIVRQNIIFALAVKALVLIMGALGYANMWEAVFADVGVSVIAICNAMRALHTGSKKETEKSLF